MSIIASLPSLPPVTVTSAQRMPADHLTQFLAVWGALVATFALGWNVFRDWLDRPKLKVTVGIRRLGQGQGGRWYTVAPDLPVQGASSELFVVLDVANVGRRPIRVNGWGGYYHKPVGGKNSFFIVPRYLPMTLKEGDSISEYTDEISPRIDNVRRLLVWDTVGRKWYVPGRTLRKLKREYHKFQGA